MDNRGKAIFFFMFDDDSDDEEHHQRVIQAIVHHTSLENEVTKHGGSVVSREYKNREREDRHHNLMSNYFIERPHFKLRTFAIAQGKPSRLLKHVRSLDCMHWEWKNFPSSWAGQFIGHKKKPIVVLEAVAPHVEYIVNGNQYYLGYYLADGIYPHWATLVKTISSLDNPKKRLFAQMQEGYRNDVERAFGIWIFVEMSPELIFQF